MSNLTPGPDHAAGVDPNVPTDGPGFLARSKKALAGGITGALTGGVTGAITAALSDGRIDGSEGWGILAFLVGGFAVGFAGVWAAPKNAD